MSGALVMAGWVTGDPLAVLTGFFKAYVAVKFWETATTFLPDSMKSIHNVKSLRTAVN